MMNMIHLDDFEMVLDIAFIVKAKGNEASSTGKKHNETLGRGQCLATLESKSRVLQSLMASSSGPIEFQRKLGDCSILGRGPEQQMKYEGSVTVGQMQCRLGSNRSLGEGMAH
ncbi:hypothetical protein ACOSQ2_010591 [Xanthoceras sorbifolium]